MLPSPALARIVPGVLVLGVSPGLASCAYSVLSLPKPELKAIPVDMDVLHGTGRSEAALAWEITKSARVHALVMGVVLERQPPAVLSFGPGIGGEPERHVEAVVTMLTDLGRLFGARIVTFQDEDEIRTELEVALGRGQRVGIRGIRAAVNGMLTERLPTGNRKVMIATAIALAGARRVRVEQLRSTKPRAST